MRSTSKHFLDSSESSSNLSAFGFFPKKKKQNPDQFYQSIKDVKKGCNRICVIKHIHITSIYDELSIFLTLEITNTCSKNNMPKYQHSTLDFTSNDLSNIRVSYKILQSLSNSCHNLRSTLSLLNIVF